MFQNIDSETIIRARERKQERKRKKETNQSISQNIDTETTIRERDKRRVRVRERERKLKRDKIKGCYRSGVKMYASDPLVRHGTDMTSMLRNDSLLLRKVQLPSLRL